MNINNLESTEYLALQNKKLIKLLNKALRQIKFIEKLNNHIGGGNQTIPSWYSDDTTSKIPVPEQKDIKSYKHAIASWRSRNLEKDSKYNTKYLQDIQIYNDNLKSLQQEWTRIGRPLTNGKKLIYGEENTNKPKTQEEYVKALAARETRKAFLFLDESIKNNVFKREDLKLGEFQNLVTKVFNNFSNNYKSQNIDELKKLWEERKPSIDGSGLIPNTQIQYAIAISKSIAKKGKINTSDELKNFTSYDEIYMKKFDELKNIDINVLMTIWQEIGKPDTNGIKTDETSISEGKKYDIKYIQPIIPKPTSFANKLAEITYFINKLSTIEYNLTEVK